MKILMERSHLLTVLKHVTGVVETRNTIPILSNVLLDANLGGIKMTTTDMDLVIVDSAPAQVEVEGAVTAPARILNEIVDKLSDGVQVELEQPPASDTLHVRSGRSNFKLKTLPDSDFPTMDESNFTTSFDLSAMNLRKMIDGTFFAISTDETRYYLNGIYFHVADGMLKGVATDGHRLARICSPAPLGAESMAGVIVPRKTVSELRKLIEEVEGDIAVALSENTIRFSFAGTVLTSKLIDGTFPDYEKVIPQGNEKVMVFDCEVFSQAVARVSTISKERGCAIKMSIAQNEVTLSANSNDGDDAQDQLEVKYSGDSMEIGFNSKYLLDVSSQIESGVAQFLMNDGASPTIISDTKDDAALYVLMPMRV